MLCVTDMSMRWALYQLSLYERPNGNTTASSHGFILTKELFLVRLYVFTLVRLFNKHFFLFKSRLNPLIDPASTEQ